MENNKWAVDAEQLRAWLEDKKEVMVLDVRPKEQREEWLIPGSVYVDAYKRLNANDPSDLNEVNIPANVPVVTVCAAGRTSMIAANELRKKGVNAYSLEGGMKAWSMAWNTATINFGKFEVVQFRRTGKGCLSYLIISDNEMVIVDASLPVEVYEQFFTKRNVTPKFIIDTHIHADHLSRSKQLAEKFNVSLYLPAQSKVKFNFNSVSEGVTLPVGDVSIKPISTPGHTLESMCFMIDEKVILSGDTLFINSIGRPDLKSGTEETKHKAGCFTILYKG